MDSQKEVNQMVEEYTKKHGYEPDIIESDYDGNIIGCGSHEDYDYYAREVMNDEGYYDERGHFIRFQSYD